ncbi:MAG: LysR family transcriptional regulator [Enhygromyxa sp.]
MSWRSVAFDWNRARAFLVAAEEGSFSAAARALGLAQPTLGRQVAALEEELGVTLFERVGNKLELSATGRELVEHVRTMSEAANRLALAAAGQSTSIEGIVRIAASEAISAYLLPPIVAEIRARHPGIEIELVVSNHTSDLLRREADIAIRNYRPTDGDLVARKLGDSAAYLYASPAYLEQIGNPITLEQLSARAELIGFEDKQRLLELLERWGLALDRGNVQISTDNHLVQWELAKQGLGMCIMMKEVGDAEPRVRRILPELPAPVRFPTWLTSHRELETSRRIRVVFDLLAAALAGS